MQPAVSKKPSWWLWPTILSLDAPAVVLLWQGLFARTAGVSAGAPERFVLGCSVWLAYSADRWIEGWRLLPEQVQTHRHRFHIRWRWEIFIVWFAVLVLDVGAAIRGLQEREFHAGLLLLLAVAAYLLSHQLVHRTSRWRAPKEACVAILIAAGSAVFVISQAGGATAALLAPVALFTLLCFCNCALISVWEDEVDLSHGQTSLALQYGRAAGLSRTLPWLAAVAAVAAGLTAGTAMAAVAACSAASGVLLGIVDLTEPRIGRIPARVLADLALMTPIVPLLLAGGPR
ncbi:MAG TPA: hypothetical protein VIJ19_11380 [Opitutaceae bacterium]